MTKNNIVCLGVLGAAMVMSSAANAALSPVYSTTFTAPTYSDGALVGQDSWVLTGTTVTNPEAVTASAGAGTVALTTSGQDVNRPFTALTPASASSVFLQADVVVTAAQATGDYFLHLGDGGTSNFFDRTYIKSSGTGFVLGATTSSGTPTYGTTVLSFNTAYRFLIRHDLVAGAGNDTGSVFVNPASADGTGDTAYVALTTAGTDPATISSLNLRQGTAASAPSVTVDNLSVSYIANVPEPTSIAALGLGSLLLRRRRA